MADIVQQTAPAEAGVPAAALVVEKQELETDVKEAKAEAAAARADGDTDRAEQIEAKVKELVGGELAEIKAAIKALTDRPFHPAPEAAPAAAPAAEDKPEDKPAEAEPKEPVHEFGSRRWFGKRAYKTEE